MKPEEKSHVTGLRKTLFYNYQLVIIVKKAFFKNEHFYIVNSMIRFVLTFINFIYFETIHIKIFFLDNKLINLGVLVIQ